MDCPNCGAYNASSSTHCRRCGAELQPESREDTGNDEWGRSFTPDEDWTEWQEPDDTQREETENPWAWSEPEPESTADPWPAPEETPGGTAAGPPAADYERSGDPAAADVPNYLWPSIAATLCCCAPLGIPAIVFASRVDTYLKNDDRKGALAASERARNWLIASVIVAVLFWGIFFATSS